MSSIEFPLPDVESRLGPYIHTRQETLKIRQALTSYVTSHLENSSEGTPSHLELLCDQSLKVKKLSSETSGFRKRYLEALKANSEARKRRDALQAQIGALSSQEKSDGNVSNPPDHRLDDYLSFLQQRRCYRKLQIIEESVRKITEVEPNPTQVNLKQFQKQELGEVPLPPASALEGESAEGHADESIFALKKEVLRAKGCMENSKEAYNTVRGSRDSSHQPDVKTKVYALRCARDELINWIERELAKINEEETEEHPGTTHDQENGSLKINTEKIQNLYDNYVSARKQFVETCTIKSPEMTVHQSKTDTVVAQSAVKSTSTLSDTARYLPFLRELLETSSNERSLLQQQSYLRRQLASALKTTDRTLSRLADESHLVPPGSTSTLAWEQADKAARGETDGFVREKIDIGEEHIKQANEILGELNVRRGDFGRLDGSL